MDTSSVKIPGSRWLLSLMLLLALNACDIQTEQTIRNKNGQETKTASSLINSKEQLDLGQKLYADNCSVCHGKTGQGYSLWRRRDAEGYWPPPPLNGSGHSWHHPLDDLRKKISQGARPGEGGMPGFGDRLDDRKIDAIIAWFQSLWPQEVYQIWYQRESRQQ